MSETIKPADTNSDPIPQETILDPILYLSGETTINDLLALAEGKEESNEQIAANIVHSVSFIIGPRKNGDTEPTILESRLYDQLLNSSARPYISIIAVGDPELDIKEDYIIKAEHMEHCELKAAHILSRISKYDAQRADELVEYVARELLIKKASENIIRVKQPEEVTDIILSLKNDPSFENNKFNYYYQLADAIEKNYKLFLEQAIQIKHQTIKQELKAYPKQTFMKRNALRIASVAMLSITSLMGYSLKEEAQVNPKTQSAVIFESNDLYDLLEGDYQLMQTGSQPQTANNQHIESIIFASQSEELSRQLKMSEFNQTQKQDLSQLDKVAKQAVADANSDALNETSLIELVHEISSERSNVGLPPDLLTYISMMTIVAGGLFSSVQLAKLASRKGGRLDKRMRAYRRGNITSRDITSSPAVNNLFGLRANKIS